MIVHDNSEKLKFKDCQDCLLLNLLFQNMQCPIWFSKTTTIVDHLQQLSMLWVLTAHESHPC